MAVSDLEVSAWLAANPLATDAQIAAAMDQYGVSSAQLARVTGLSVPVVEQRKAAAQPSYSQDYVNQLVREAAAQAGGTLSYSDVLNAARNMGIPESMVDAAMSTGVITGGQTPAPVVQAPEPVVQAPEPARWDYNEYLNTIKKGGDYTQAIGNLAAQDPVMANNALRIYQEIQNQQKLGTADAWAKGNTASKEAAAADFALRLAEAGVSSLGEVGQRTVETLDGEGGTYFNLEYFNKATGEPLKDWDRLSQSFKSGTKLNYRLDFTPDGIAVPYTTPKQSDWVEFREGTLKPAAALFGSILLGPQVSSLIGSATGLTGAGLSAATGATLGAGSAALTGGDILKGALLGGAAGYATGSIGGGDVGITDRQFAIADAKQLADAGLNSAQIADVLSSAGFNDAIISRAIGSIGAVPADSVLVTAPRIQQPVGVAPGLLGASIGAQSITPSQLMPPSGQTVEIVGERPRDTAILPGVIGNNISGGISTTPITSDQVVEIVGERPRDTLVPPSTITEPVIPTPIIPTPIDIPKIQAPKDVTVKDVINTIGAVGTVAGLVDAATAGDKGFDIVDVPSEWRTPTYGVPGGSAWPRLTPIDFGSRELLRGTQWENFINQPVAQIPVVQPQQTGMSYADLVSALQGNQGPRLTIGDIISGIQGQYGQINPGSVG